MTLGEQLTSVSQLVRLHALGYTAHWPLVAMATSGSSASTGALWCVILVCLSFNVYGYIQNDINDLENDRLDPGRQKHPLMTGQISVQSSQRIMHAQLPIMAAIHLISGNTLLELQWLVFAVVFISVYNIYSKRCPFPPAIDCTLGLSGFCLTLYGADLVGTITFSTLLLATFSLIYFLLINAFNNNLRDLNYELQAGSRNTAKYLGARLSEAGDVVIGRRLLIYGSGLQLLLVFLAFTVGSYQSESAITTIIVACLNCGVAIVFWLFATRSDPVFSIMLRVHFFVLPLPVMAACFPEFTGPLLLTLLAVYVGPLILLLLTRSVWRIDVFNAPHSTQTRNQDD